LDYGMTACLVEILVTFPVRRDNDDTMPVPRARKVRLG
jgi:hypothetical protein